MENGYDNDSSSGIALATRERNIATENPGAFTITGADTWVASTIAVRPAAGGGGIEIDTGRFVPNTSTGNQSITGVGFQPKAYILFITKAAVDDVNSGLGESLLSIGMTDGTNQVCVASGEQDNQTSSDVGRRGMTDEVLCSIAPHADQYIDAEANHVSMDADGFTINIADIPNTPTLPLVHYIAFGGDDLSVDVGTVDLADTNNTSVDVTAPGFEPDVVITSFIGDLQDLDSIAKGHA